MWIRRCVIDARLEAPLPIPTQIASNEEFIPPPQSLEQRKVEALTLDLAEKPAKAQGLSRRQFLREASDLKGSLELLNLDHYVKEIFFDSDTVMAIISGVPTAEWNKNPLPPDRMVATRKHVNGLAGSKRVLSHGLLRPNLCASELEEMERQVKTLKVDAWKMYTGAEIGKN